MKLQKDSKDSGTINDYSAILGFRALNIRLAYERLEAMEEGVIMIVRLKKVHYKD